MIRKPFKDWDTAERWVEQYHGDTGAAIWLIEVYESSEDQVGKLWVVDAEAFALVVAENPDFEIKYLGEAV